MGFYTSFVSAFAFPLQERVKGHDTVRVRKALESSQWLRREDLEREQLMRLRSFLASAGRDVPYYRELFSASGFDPGDIDSVAGLARIPFLDKPLIRANLASLRAVDATGLARFTTGGSSGEPLTFYLGRRIAHDVAAKWRATRWWDVDIGDREFVFWGSPIELGKQDILKSLRDRLLRSTLLSAFDLSEPRIDEYIRKITRARPKMLFGYPSVISLIAQHARGQGIRMDGLGIEVAFVTAERLYDWQKAAIAEVFGCRVANGYGGRDAGFIAHECPAGGMHVTAEDVIIEIIDGQGQVLPAGEQGEIVVTHLATGDFPFIRYRTGDIGALSGRACPCGRGLPLMESIEGRTTDFIRTRSGKLLHGLSLIYVLREQEGVQAFRIIQEDLDHIRVLLVPGADYAVETGGAIARGIIQRMEPDTRVEIELVDALPEEASGKYRYVFSRIGRVAGVGGN